MREAKEAEKLVARKGILLYVNGGLAVTSIVWHDKIADLLEPYIGKKVRLVIELAEGEEEDQSRLLVRAGTTLPKEVGIATAVAHATRDDAATPHHTFPSDVVTTSDERAAQTADTQAADLTCSGCGVPRSKEPSVIMRLVFENDWSRYRTYCNDCWRAYSKPESFIHSFEDFTRVPHALVTCAATVDIRFVTCPLCRNAAAEREKVGGFVEAAPKPQPPHRTLVDEDRKMVHVILSEGWSVGMTTDVFDPKAVRLEILASDLRDRDNDFRVAAAGHAYVTVTAKPRRKP